MKSRFWKDHVSAEALQFLRANLSPAHTIRYETKNVRHRFARYQFSPRRFGMSFFFEKKKKAA